MKAVIIAAGKSTRTYPLTIYRPKPLLPVLDETILSHNLKQLMEFIDEVILVIGFKGDMIKSYVESLNLKIKVTYVEQKEQCGTGHALLQCRDIIQDERFIVLGGDDLFSQEDIREAVNKDVSILASIVKNPKAYGVIEEKDGKLLKIHEKQENPISDIVNTGFYVLPKKVFDLLSNVQKSQRGEIELTDALSALNLDVVKIKDYWLPITYPWNLLEANVFLLNREAKMFNSEGKIEDNVTIKGDVYIGKGTIIKSGSYIEGPVYIGKNCSIGPLAHIRPDTIIGDECEIGKMELYDVLIMNKVTSKHTSYAAHSIIGNNVNIGAGTITADYRHDGKDHITIINDKKVNSNRRKLGAFIGDNVNTGIGTLIYPGRKLWSNTSTLPGEIIKVDKILDNNIQGDES